MLRIRAQKNNEKNPAHQTLHHAAKSRTKVCEVLDSGYLTEGPITHELETAVKDYADCRFALAVCNCTVGLEMALRALGIGPGDEVFVVRITPTRPPPR